MKKCFNIEGRCRPTKHYMVNLDKRLAEIKFMVDDGKYFVINRGRQYGKTTTLYALANHLKNDYVVVRLSFQQVDSDLFATSKIFANEFAKKFFNALPEYDGTQFLDSDVLKKLSPPNQFESLSEVFECLSALCKTAQKPIVLIIDEVDKVSNYQVFIDFLGQIRDYYFAEDLKKVFKSVILAGVYSIENLRIKYRKDKEHKTDSPWNIGAKFKVDMDFSPEDIESMLKEYEADHQTGMDLPKIAQLIFDYTSGYPVLVSSICKELDEEISGTEQFPTLKDAWTEEGVMEAIRILVSSPAAVFESMLKQTGEYPELKDMLKRILFQGESIEYNEDDFLTKLGNMFGYVRNKNGRLMIANRIFETRLYNLFLYEDKMKSSKEKTLFDTAENNKPLFIQDNVLNMDLILEKFVEYFTELSNKEDDSFIEKQGRKLFLIFLRPIINGVGNYSIESETRNNRRTDVVVYYLGKKYVIELKIWHGKAYNEAGEKQLTDYLKDYHLDKGYLLTFSFIKDKKIGLKTKKVKGKTILEAIV